MSGDSNLLAGQVIRAATAQGLRIAVAESLTGGMLASELVSVPGASNVFSGGIVAYDTVLKRTLLGVDATLLAGRGPVDAAVAKQMALGVRAACAIQSEEGVGSAPADLGIATTGVAGPDPDPQTGQAAGTVWLGVSSARGERSIELRLAGGRAEIRVATVRAALEMLLAELESRS